MATTTRTRVYRFIQKFIQDHGYAPSFREIADGAGLASTNSVFVHLEMLKGLGLLERTPGIARSIVVTGGKAKDATTK